MRVTQEFYCQICQATEQVIYDTDSLRPQHVQGLPRHWGHIHWGIYTYTTSDLCPSCMESLSERYEAMKRAQEQYYAPVAALTD